MSKCTTIEQGDVEIAGIGTVYRRLYTSHKRGQAIFYNNRRGGMATVYPDAMTTYINGVEQKHQSEIKMNAIIAKALSNND